MKRIPHSWPSGEKLFLKYLSSNQNYYYVTNLWITREELVGEMNNIDSTVTDDDLTEPSPSCDERYREFSSKYIFSVDSFSQDS